MPGVSGGQSAGIDKDIGEGYGTDEVAEVDERPVADDGAERMAPLHPRGDEQGIVAREKFRTEDDHQYQTDGKPCSRSVASVKMDWLR